MQLWFQRFRRTWAFRETDFQRNGHLSNTWRNEREYLPLVGLAKISPVHKILRDRKPQQPKLATERQRNTNLAPNRALTETNTLHFTPLQDVRARFSFRRDAEKVGTASQYERFSRVEVMAGAGGLEPPT